MGPVTVADRLALWRRAFLVGAFLSPVGAIGNGLPGFLYVTAGATVVAAIVLNVEAWARRRFGPAGAPKLPALGFIGWGLIPTFIAILGLISRPVGRGTLLFAAFAAAWWIVAFLLVRGVLTAVVLALVLMAVPWGFFAVQVVAGGVLILREIVRTQAIAAGSIAFLLTVGAVLVLVVFAPLTLIAVRLVSALRRERRRRRDVTVSALPQSAR